MHERFLYRVITTGVAWLKGDRDIFDDLFIRELELEQTEADEIWTWWQEHTPAVHHSYPRRDFTPPFYSLVLGTDSEAEHVVGDDAGMVSDPDDPRYGQDCLVSFWEQQHNILCVTDHPDATLYIYHALKYIMASADDQLANKGFYDIHYSGADLEPDPRYMPEHWFIRAFTLTFKSEFQRLDAGSALGKAWRVGGIHLDAQGAPGEDTGGVKTQVYIAPVTED